MLFCTAFPSAFAFEPYEAEQADPLSEAWRWRHITRLDDAGFRCMEEDTSGTMWFGVNRGVLRYDGVRWTSYTAEDGFTDEPITFICRAHDGSIYAASRKKIWRFFEEKWERLEISTTIVDLSRSKSGIWIASYNGAIHVNENRITLYGTNPKAASLIDIPSTPVHHYAIPKGLIPATHFSVSSVHEQDDGILWFAVNGNMLIRLDPSKESRSRSSYQIFTHNKKRLLLRPPIKINSTGTGQILVSSASGVFVYRPASKDWSRRWFPGMKSYLGQPFVCTHYDQDHLIIAVSSHLYVGKGEDWSIYQNPSLERSLPHVLHASDGSLWLGKGQGKVFRIDLSNRQWTTFKDVHFQCRDAENRSWFVTSDNRAVVLSEGQWISYSVDDGLMDTLMGIYCSRNGQIWAVGCHGHTASTAYLKGNSWIRNVHKNFSESFSGRIGMELENGGMLFASRTPKKKSHSGGIIQASPSENGGYSFTQENVTLDKSSRVSGMVQTAEGLYYSSTQLYQKKGETVEKVALPAAVESRTVDVIAKDAKEQLWMAVRDAGVCCLSGTNWISYTAKDDLGSSRVSGLVSASDGTMWASMADGISRFDGKYWQSNVLDAGLKGFAIGDGSLKCGQDDSIWINSGYRNWYVRESSKTAYVENPHNLFKATHYRPAQNEPQTEIILFSEQVSPPGNAFIEWTGVSQWESTPKKDLTYSWRINGEEWSPFSKKTNHLFLSLKSGTYQLEVRARDRDFNIDSTPAACSFVVLAPVWQQSWFIITMILFSVGLISLAYLLIREKHEAQQHQIEMEQIKLRFLTSISHEFRTPLTVMLAPLQSLLASVNDPKAKEIVQMMMRNGQRLCRLVDQVLDFRKLDVGRMPIDWAQGDIVELTETIIDELKPLAEHAGISIHTEVPDAAGMVWFDPDKWQKVLSNLINNAIKYTPQKGSVYVRVKMTAGEDHEPRSITVQIEDSGIGIPEEDQAHIFERYYRAKSSAKGTGIGLAFVKQLLDLMNGTISFASPITECNGQPCGTRFCVELPVSAKPPADFRCSQQAEYSTMPEALCPSVQVPVDEEDHGDTAKPTLLVVDDHEDIRRMIQSALADHYSILTAENGTAGLNAAKEAMPDLILSDVMMPVMDGFELCRTLKSTEITSHIPVILLTARTSQENELEGLHTGADDYITKPFTIPILKARIHAQLESRRIMRERFSSHRPFDAQEITGNPLDQAFLERAMRLIDERIGDYEFNAETFAAEMGMGERTLRNKIKAITNQTPAALIRKQRLQRAKHLLEQSGQTMRISEIAGMAGFLDLSYFGKLLKKEYGKTPSEMMKSPELTPG